MTSQHTRSSSAIDNAYKIKPRGLYWRSHTLFITSTVAMGLFTDLFLYGLVVPVLPFLCRDRLAIPSDQIQKHVSGLLAAYAASCLAFAPLSGFIADKTATRQKPYLCGLLALLCATIVMFYARTEIELILARILQGASAVTVWTIGLALCLETVSPDRVGTTIGSVFSFANVAILLAPVIGGLVYKQIGYGGIFGISLGLIILDLIMRLFVVEKKIAHRYDSEILDPMLMEGSLGQGEFGNNVTEPLLGMDKDKTDFLIPQNVPSIFKGIPILYCLRNPRLLSALFLTMMQAVLYGAFDATVPTEAHSLFGFSSLEAGLLFIPLGLCNLVVGPVAGWLVDKYGTKAMSMIGYGSLVPLLASLRMVQAGEAEESGGKKQIILFAIVLASCGIGLGLIGAPPSVEAGAVVTKYHKANPKVFGDTGPYGQLYALNAMMFAMGLTIGPFLSGALRDCIGYGNMNAVLASLCALSALLSYFFIERMPTWTRKWRGSHAVSGV